MDIGAVSSLNKEACGKPHTHTEPNTHTPRERERELDGGMDGWMDAPTHTHTQIHYIDRPFYPYPSLSSCGLKNTKLSAES